MSVDSNVSYRWQTKIEKHGFLKHIIVGLLLVIISPIDLLVTIIQAITSWHER